MVTKIKDNISQKEFRHLINYIKSDETLRSKRKERLIKVYTLLYNLGLRVNELSQFTNSMMLELIQNKKLKIVSHKQKLEKYVYITESSQKDLKKLFGDLETDDRLIFISERGNNTPLSINSMIRDTNSYLKVVFPNKNITSHSFRQTLITELSQKNINTKVIQQLIGHKDISTTYRYIKPSENDLIDSLEVVR